MGRLLILSRIIIHDFLLALLFQELLYPMHLLLHFQTIVSFSLPLIFYALENHIHSREKKFSIPTHKLVLSCPPPISSSSVHWNFDKKNMSKANSTILHTIERNISFDQIGAIFLRLNHISLGTPIFHDTAFILDSTKVPTFL